MKEDRGESVMKSLLYPTKHCDLSATILPGTKRQGQRAFSFVHLWSQVGLVFERAGATLIANFAFLLPIPQPLSSICKMISLSEIFLCLPPKKTRVPPDAPLHPLDLMEETVSGS